MRELAVEYRRWRIQAMPPFVRVGMTAHFFNWAAYLTAVAVFRPDDFGSLLPAVAGLMVVVIGCVLFTWVSALTPFLVPTTAFVNALVGLNWVWQVHGALGYDTRVGLTTGAMAIGTFFAFTVFRMPPWWAVLSFVPFGGLSAAYAVDDYRDGLIGVDLLAGNLLILGLSFLTGLLVCCLVDYLGYKAYAAEQTIAKQQAQLQTAQRLIRRYAPAAVAGRIESGDAEAVGQPQRLRVTALSSDVAGFTALADRIDPESLSQIVNEYVATMSDAVESQGGVVTEFAGDGLMAIFGAPEQLEPADQVRRALAAAGAMHTRLADLNETWFRLGIEQPLRVRIGVNTGMLSVGTFGSDGRATYTAIGLQMNVAARIQAECKPGGILLSGASWHLVKDDVDCDPLGEVTVKGIHFPISIYTPRS